MVKKLSTETKIKYAGAVSGLVISFVVLLLTDTGFLKITQTDFYKGSVIACASSLKIIKPKYKTEGGN